MKRKLSTTQKDAKAARKEQCGIFADRQTGGCWFCDSEKFHVHHLAGRGNESYECQSNYLAACLECHAALHRLPSSVKCAVSLAAKKMYDPEHYDRLGILQLAMRASSAVTEQDVDDWVRLMGGKR